jgi:transcriptional regulator with XRE-family HTH domain
MMASRNVSRAVAKRSRRPGKPTLQGETKKNVQRAIREALARVDDNRTALGDAIGASQPTVSEWANGNSSPQLPNIEALARLLDKRVAEVLEGDKYSLENAIAYWPGRWPTQVIAEGRRLAEKGEKYDAQGWTLRLDELKERANKR